MLSDIAEQIKNTKLRYKHSIILGDNASGKSEVIRQIVQKGLDEFHNIYYIDSVNRYFNVDKTMEESSAPEFKGDYIVSYRLDPQCFNLKDSFNCFGTFAESVEQIYAVYEEKIQTMLKNFVGTTFYMLRNGLGEVEFESGTGKLSSGYQALTRIFLELLYYQDKVIDTLNLVESLVVIDELDEFLSPKNAGIILPFLTECFPKMNFVCSTHSIDLIVGAQNANVIVLYDRSYEVLDSADFLTFSETSLLFRKIFGEKINADSDAEDVLRKLLNNKIAGVWTDTEERMLHDMEAKELSNSQRLLYRQIMDTIEAA